MSDLEGSTEALYRSDEYVRKNPTLHEEDSAWKIGKILPVVDLAFARWPRERATLLDVGGGAGLIGAAVADRIRIAHGIPVATIAMDLSPGMLDVQRRNNPHLDRTLNEDIRTTSLSDKEVDLTLLIDVLEHLADPERALAEVRRISRLVLLKVPLEDNLFLRMKDVLTRGRTRRQAIEQLGHINVYSHHSLKRQIESHLGNIVSVSLCNAYEYVIGTDHFAELPASVRLRNRIGAGLFRLAPEFTARLLEDYSLMLVRCE